MVNDGIRETFAQALCLPDYRDWALSREIIKARLTLLALCFVAGVAGTFVSIWVFVLIFPLVLGLTIAVGFDLFLAGGREGGRRLRGKIVGAERIEIQRLEALAQLDYNGFTVKPSFVRGLGQGLWLELGVLERATGKRIAPSMAMNLGKALTRNKQRWIPLANSASITRHVEPVGQQFFSIWLEKTAIPYWSNLEQEALHRACSQ